MKYALAVALLCCVAIVSAQSGTPQNVFTSDQIKWGPAPPFVQPGAQIAILEGDPMASSGDYTLRFKMPNGYKVAPHWHPKRENVTVLAGNLKVGMGDTFDASKMKSFPPGTFAYMDPEMHHYVMASGETILQIHGTSPVEFNYINPADDPRKK
jgi:hypothetical protein